MGEMALPSRVLLAWCDINFKKELFAHVMY